MVKRRQTHSGPARPAEPVPTSPSGGPAGAQAQPSTGADTATPPAPRRVFVVDDHPMVRRGLVQTINNEPDLAVCGQGEDTYAAVRAIGEAQPDVAVVDISLKGGDGIELVKELKRQGLNTPVLILSMHDETLYAERALRAGARGYIMKQEAPETLVCAIRKVLGGETYVSPEVGGTLLRRTAA
jgi:DNA-binding NarL/FixJ family response regulator